MVRKIRLLRALEKRELVSERNRIFANYLMRDVDVLEKKLCRKDRFSLKNI